MTQRSLRCQNADEVLLLLKCSDRVTHDVSSALDSCSEPAGAASVEAAAATVHESTTATPLEAPPDEQDGGSAAALPEGAAAGGGALPLEHGGFQHVLALRKWYDLKPGREFRCFVRDHRLVGVSQRDVTRRFEGLEAEAARIQSRIEAFHTQHVQGRFPQRRYAYDCYVPTSEGAAVRLVDFNPAGGTTGPLLFDAEELWPEGEKGGGQGAPQPFDGDDGHAVDFRVVTGEVALRPDTAAYGVPYDFVDDTEGGALSALLQQARAAGELWQGLNRQGGNEA